MTNVTMTQTEKENNLEILAGFCSKDPLRDWMTGPFTLNNKIHATDGYILVITDLDKVHHGNTFLEVKESMLKGLIPTQENKNLIIKTDSLINALSKAPTKKAQITKEKIAECEECNGSGDVEWDYYEHTKIDDCPVCDGTGNILLKTKIDSGEEHIEDHVFIEIGNSRFMASKVSSLVDVCIKIDVDHIKLVYQYSPTSGSFLKVGHFDVLLMPTTNKDDDMIIATYK